MFIHNKIKIQINNNNIKYYNSFYNDLEINKFVEIDIKNLPRYSNYQIDIKCDNCDIEKSIKYKLYRSYGYNNGEYTCRKCKLKLNNLEKYGVENVFQLKSVKEKSKISIKEKYGVDYISQSSFIKDKIKDSNIKKYGKEHHLQNESILKKQIKTNLERYGVKNVSQDKNTKDKKIKKNLERYGVDYIFLDKSFKDNLIKSNIEKYGVCYNFQSDDIRNKIKKTNLEKYGVDNPSKNIDIRNKIKNTNIKTLHEKIFLLDKNILNIDSDKRIFNIFCDDCQSTFEIGYYLFYKRRETKTCICTNCNLIDKHQSGLEIQLQKFIQKIYTGEIIFNFKLENKEIDIYIPDLNLGFEFNGLYWHSEIYKEKNYHLDKTKLYLSKNIQLIHIWEDDWIYKKEIVQSMIRNKLGLIYNKIYARKCEIREVTDNKVVKDFLNTNHIQGYTGSYIKIGLFYNNELVSLMSFKKNVKEYELNRFANKLNIIVVGGASKLLNYFIKNYSNNITTFSNNSYSNGNLYLKLNFKKLYELKSDYHYVIGDLRVHKFNLRNKDVSNIFRIYDAGKIKYKYDINS